MLPDRNKTSYQTFIHTYIQKVYVICPGCGRQAIVTAPPFSEIHSNRSAIRITCTNCGYNNKYEELLAGSNAADYKTILIGTNTDPYFKIPLWLQINCCGNTLWAYNYEHLSFLEELVAAKLRERNTVITSNGNIASKLPKWMLDKTNRTAVKKAIEELKLI